MTQRRATALPEPSEIMMPVPEEAALRLTEIEALRQISDNLRRLNDGHAQMLTTVHQIDARLIRQEVQNEQIKELKAELKAAKDDIDGLKSDKDKRTGAVNLVEWFARNWIILAVVFLVAAITLRTSGKLSL